MENEEKKETVVTDTTKTEEKETPETKDSKVEETKSDETKDEGKTFTQEEFNDALKREVARKTKGIPSKEELKAYNEWKESQKTEEERKTEKEQEYQKTISERDSYKKENSLLRKGVNIDDLDYVLFKVSKMEGEFDDNLETFLKDNPKYLVKNEPKEIKTVDLGSDHNEKDVKDDALARKIMGLE